MMARGRAAILVCLALGAGCERRQPEVAEAQRLATPFPLESLRARDLDGVDRSSATWTGKVVVVNVWATWCPPCRREIPALAALQTKYVETVLVLGLLQDNIGDDAARTFGRNMGMNYPIVRSTFDIEAKLPAIPVLPMTFIVDRTGRLVAMFAGEIDPAAVEAEIVRLLPTTTPGVPSGLSPAKRTSSVISRLPAASVRARLLLRRPPL